MRIDDKNGNRLKINDRVKDKKGVIWKLENISGVAMCTRRDKNKILESVVFRKFFFTECEKI